MKNSVFTGHNGTPDFSEARVVFAVVCHGSYRRFLEICADIEALHDVTLIYRRASPQKLFIVEQGAGVEAEADDPS